MSRAPKPAALPDIPPDGLADAEIRRRLQPLAEAVLPGRGEGPASTGLVDAPPTRKRARRGIEFLWPEQVVTEIKTRAAQRGISATVLILEHLRDLGYPVEAEDFIDLRKAPRR